MSISDSQLSRKNNKLDPKLGYYLFKVSESKSYILSLGEKAMSLKIIDSTTLLLNLTNYKWAIFRKAKVDDKLHLRLGFMD